MRARSSPAAGVRCSSWLRRSVALRRLFDEALGIEWIDQGHHAAGYHAQFGGEGALTAAGFGGDHPQNADFRWGEPDFGYALGEALGGVRAELGELECHRAHRADQLRLFHILLLRFEHGVIVHIR